MARVSASMPRGSGLDEMFAWQSMVTIANKSKNDYRGAMQEAHSLARPYVSDSTSIRGFAWLWPAVAAIAEENVIASLEDDLDIRAKNLNELLRKPDVRKYLDQEVPVLRAWGARGQFLALLLDHLESGGRFASCQLCGQLNPANRSG